MQAWMFVVQDHNVQRWKETYEESSQQTDSISSANFSDPVWLPEAVCGQGCDGQSWLSREESCIGY